MIATIWPMVWLVFGLADMLLDWAMTSTYFVDHNLSSLGYIADDMKWFNLQKWNQHKVIVMNRHTIKSNRYQECDHILLDMDISRNWSDDAFLEMIEQLNMYWTNENAIPHLNMYWKSWEHPIDLELKRSWIHLQFVQMRCNTSKQNEDLKCWNRSTVFLNT